MYWNATIYPALSLECMLNSNIRCIEIEETKSLANNEGSWIVTLDVLKLIMIVMRFWKATSWIVTLDV